MPRVRLILPCLLAIACGPATTTPTPGSPERTEGDPCRETETMAEITRLRAEGYLSRALTLSELQREREGCDSAAARRASAEALADLGLDERAIAAWQEYAALAATDRATAEAAIAELRARPSPLADVPAERRAEALALYRTAADLRLQGRHDQAIALLRRSYAAAPHPLTIVQIGVAHQSAGRDVDARKAFERALAIAELRAGRPAEPRLARGHSGSVAHAVFSPDGRWVATASNDGSVKLWDAATARELRSWNDHGDVVDAVAFSPDGAHVVSGSWDRTVRIWSADTGSLERSLSGHRDAVAALAFHPDGTRFASAGWDGQVFLWELASGQRLRELSVGDQRSRAVAISADGRMLAASAEDGTVHLWDASDGRLLRVLRGHTQSVHGLAFASTGLLASASSDETVRIWSPGDGKLMRTITLTETGDGVAFSPDGALLAYSDGEHARVVSATTGAAAATLPDAVYWVDSIAFSADGTRLVTADGQGAEARTFDATSGRLLRTLGAQPGWINAVSLSPDGKQLASGSEHGTVRIWELGGAGQPRALGRHEELIWTVAFSTDGKQLLSGGLDKRLRLWDVAGRRERWSVDAGAVVFAARFSPDGSQIAAASTDVQLYAVADGKLLGKLPAGGQSVWDVRYRGDGVLAAATWDGWVYQYAPDGRPLTDLRHGGHFRGLSWSPDGALLAGAGGAGEVSLWPADGTAGAIELTGHGETATSVLFHPDGKRLISTSEDRTVRVWDPATGKPFTTLEAHSSGVLDADLTADGRLLATGSRDGTIMLWDGQTFAQLATLLVLEDGRWVAFTPEGMADGSAAPADGSSLLYWQIGDVQLPGFVGWPRAHRAGLLGALARTTTGRAE